MFSSVRREDQPSESLRSKATTWTLRGALGTTIAALGLIVVTHVPYAQENKSFTIQPTSTPESYSPRSKVSTAARAAYAGTPMEQYINNYPGIIDVVDCRKSGTAFDGQIFIGFAIVGNPQGEKKGNKIHEMPELESPVIGTLNASQSEASQRAIEINNFGSTETWVEVGRGFVLTRATSGSITEVYAATPGYEECKAENTTSTVK